MIMMTKNKCAQCGKEFDLRVTDLERGRGKFCGSDCYHKSTLGHKNYHQAKVRSQICPVCGNEFLVGGRGNAHSKVVFCSQECCRKGRYRRGAECLILTEVQAAYIAGVIDGEGSIMLYLRRDVVAMRVVVSNSFRAMLDWIAEVTGVGAVNNQYQAVPGVRKATFSWGCNADAARSLLDQIKRYLLIKTRQADLAIETQERLRDPKLKADRTWQEAYRQQMKALNQRG